MAEPSNTDSPHPQLPSAQPCSSDQPPDHGERPEPDQLVSSLPTEKGWLGPVCLYKNFWCSTKDLPAISAVQTHFAAHDSDILLASKPKSGTTWLKALAFSALRRCRFHPADPDHPLLSSNPHELVPFLEFKLYRYPERLPDLTGFPAPRLFSTHLPYELLPDSVHRSRCRVIYICRNPLDTVVSSWHYLTNARPGVRTGSWPIDELFDYFCRGIEGFGPFWSHMLGYWKPSSEMPDKVLFLKYEDLKDDVAGNLRKIADFMGVPFSEGEEKAGVVEEIVRMCSLSNLKELEVNKMGSCMPLFENKYYFRKGEVGDWVNYLTPAMAARMQGIMEEKLSPFGLTFRISHETRNSRS